MNLTGERSQQTQRRAGWQTELSDFSKQIASRRPGSVAMLSRSGRMAVNHHMENGRGHRTERRGKRQRTQILSVPDLHTEDFGGTSGGRRGTQGPRGTQYFSRQMVRMHVFLPKKQDVCPCPETIA